jgi:oxygen-independent coproporphyrinogen-3 oxidase
LPNEQTLKAPGIYVHVPLCRSKCAYCDFYSVVNGDRFRYIKAVEKEVASIDVHLEEVDSLYLGGGTPSLLRGVDIERLIETVRGGFDLAEDLELTLEANPDDVSEDSLAAWRALGVNRLSLGVQSLFDEDLRFFGRRHSAKQAVDAVTAARKAGFDNIGLDLIFGFRGQNIERWQTCIKKALELEPAHLSCYQLTIAEGTPFGRDLAAGRFKRLDEGSERRFFVLTSELLQSQGFEHYEISNFARDRSLRSRHNQKYWRHAPYIGLGPAAHSFVGRERWSNIKSLDGYCDSLESGTAPIVERERLSDEQLDTEELMLGLRTSDGVAGESIERLPDWEVKLERLVREGLAVVENGRVRPTLEGFLAVDSLPLRLL